jgi:hypothetical protein
MAGRPVREVARAGPWDCRRRGTAAPRARAAADVENVVAAAPARQRAGWEGRGEAGSRSMDLKSGQRIKRRRRWRRVPSLERHGRDDRGACRRARGAWRCGSAG